MNESTPVPAADENQIVAERRAKLAELRLRGPAFPNDFRREQLAGDLHRQYGHLDRDALEQTRIEVAVAGRMMLKRVMGKVAFATVQDMSGRIQFFVAKDDAGEAALEEFKRWDIGDLIAARGVVFKTQKGELSVRVKELRLMAKALRPLPDKFHGLEDREQRYRQRYVDLIMNEDTRAAFLTRSKAIAAMREFMVAEGFLEVETPMLQVIPGGAAAKPFVTHHNALDIDMFLRIAPELYLKRLVVGGFERVFEINRNFRNEGVSPRHNPEFTMMEFYAAYQDYTWLMDFTERLLRRVAIAATGSAVLSYQGQTHRPVAAFRAHDDRAGDPCACRRLFGCAAGGPRFSAPRVAREGQQALGGSGPGRPAARAIRGTRRVEADPADLHRRLSGRGFAARPRI